MRRTALSLAALWLLANTGVVFGHWCNNVYRIPGCFLVKAESSVKTIGKDGGTLHVYLKNNLPFTYRDVRLRAVNDNLDVTVEPSVLPSVAPGEKKQVTVTIKPKPGTRVQDYELKIMMGTAAWKNFEMMAAEASASQLKEFAAREKNEWTRLIAHELLAVKGDADAVTALHATLGQNKPPASSFAAYALGSTRSPQAVELLAKAASQADMNEQVLASIAWSLGYTKAKNAAAPLERLAKSPADPVRVSALAGLSLLGHKVNEQALVEGLGHRDFMARLHAAGALLVRGHADAEPELTKCLGNRDWGFASIAGHVMLHVSDAKDKGQSSTGALPTIEEFRKLALGKQVDLIRSWGTTQATEAAPLLTALLQSKSADLRAQAATALGRMKHEDSLEAIEKLAADDPSPLVKRAASA
ncbi:MAG: hypothetical protein FJ272_10720, partial [Planctomycetes bacterium]|nr:hypothetical protein [Planctomycetota bacterium]